MLSTQQKLRTPGWQDLVSLGFEALTESTKGMVVWATCVSWFDSDGRVLVWIGAAMFSVVEQTEAARCR